MSEESERWPFDQPPNCTTFTTQQVIDRLEPILEVYHNAEDHGWQFFGTTGGTFENAKIVCLEEIVLLDETVVEVADLAPGWCATRSAPGDPWERYVNIRELSEEEFRETFCEPMERLEGEAHRPIPLEDYVSECIAALKLPTTFDDIEIHETYLSGNKMHSHVLFYYGQQNRYLCIVIDHECDCVAGYRILDFGKE